MRHLGRSIALVTAVCWSSGCASQMGMGRARTLPKGTTQADLGLEAAVVGVKVTPSEALPLPWAHLNVGVHGGVTDDLELGFRGWGAGLRGLSSFGAAADSKVSLRKSRDVDVAVALSAAYHGVSLGGFLWSSGTLTLPLLIGANFEGHQLVLGPRLAGTVWGSESMKTLWLVHVGAGAALSLYLGKGLFLTPEVVMLHTPIGFNGTRDDPERKGATTTVLGLGLSFR